MNIVRSGTRSTKVAWKTYLKSTDTDTGEEFTDQPVPRLGS
jgi:hypothetical protein